MMLDKLHCPLTEKKLALALLFLRLSIALVFILWTFDKILAPGHTVNVFTHFYGISISENIAIGIGAVQLLFVAAFLVGYRKSQIYLFALLIHSVSTLSSFSKYLEPFNNLLFFTAWPMLAACFALYYLREFDTLFSYPSKTQNGTETKNFDGTQLS